MIVPQVIQLFPLHVGVFVEYNKNGILDHWGELWSILDLLFWERGGRYILVVI